MKEKTEKCQTCLTSGRKLISTRKIRSILKAIRFEQLKTFKNICWECHRIIIKFYSFRMQVIEAQTALHKKVQNQKPFSKLAKTIKNNYDCEFTYTEDKQILSETVKQEVDSYNVDSYDSDENLQAFVENKEISKNTELKKFEIVIYNEEELLKSRDEKRKQPNYVKIPFKCDSCVLGFTRQDYLDLHMKKKHEETIGPHKCQVCSTRFATEQLLTKHHKKHYEHYKCLLCDYKTGAYKAACNHARDKHEFDDVDRICCKHCDFVGRTAKELSEHSQKVHTLICNECGLKFKGRHTLRTHIQRIHAVERQYICEVCKRTFLTKSRLETHMANHGRNQAYCAVCRVQYKNIQAYRNHLRNHVNHAENRYPCQDCNKKFASKVYRTKHYNFYHLKKSKYKCESCNKLFISEWRLKNHNQKHHGLSRSRDHACNVCHKKFYTPSSLATHAFTHAATRRFMCETCGHTFKQRAALYTHLVRTHKHVGKT